MLLNSPSNRNLWIGWGLLWPFLVALVANPINNGIFRLALLLVILLLWLDTVRLMWRHRLLRWIPLLLALIAVTVLSLPGRPPSVAGLRDEYVSSLKGYEGVAYIWGGENRLGIDCSGLIRRGFIVANFKQGIKTLNGRLLRNAVSLWWYDTSAKGLMNGYRDSARTVLDVNSINQLDSSRILPGDFAVTTSGVHVLVYIGDGVWMEANPGKGKVIKSKVPVEGNMWFKTPVRITRWRLLDSRTTT